MTNTEKFEGFKKEMLYELLYEERRLIDHFDKSLAIYPAEFWPCFQRVRDEFRERALKREETNDIAAEVLEIIRRKGFVSSSDIGFKNTIVGDWGNNSKLARAVLEVLYYQGDTMIHHKRGTRKFKPSPKVCLRIRIFIKKIRLRMTTTSRNGGF